MIKCIWSNYVKGSSKTNLWHHFTEMPGSITGVIRITVYGEKYFKCVSKRLTLYELFTDLSCDRLNVRWGLDITLGRINSSNLVRIAAANALDRQHPCAVNWHVNYLLWAANPADRHSWKNILHKQPPPGEFIITFYMCSLLCLLCLLRLSLRWKLMWEKNHHRSKLHRHIIASVTISFYVCTKDMVVKMTACNYGWDDIMITIWSVCSSGRRHLLVHPSLL